MKTSHRFAAIALTAGALVMTCAGAANAQLPENMKFTTTFPFMVGSTTLPAGAYTVRPLPQDNALLEISNGHDTVLVLTENDSPKVQPRQDEVIFVKRDDSYVLKNIWDSATRSGVEPVPTHAERQMMHKKTKMNEPGGSGGEAPGSQRMVAIESRARSMMRVGRMPI